MIYPGILFCINDPTASLWVWHLCARSRSTFAAIASSENDHFTNHDPRGIGEEGEKDGLTLWRTAFEDTVTLFRTPLTVSLPHLARYTLQSCPVAIRCFCSADRCPCLGIGVRLEVVEMGNPVWVQIKVVRLGSHFGWETRRLPQRFGGW